MMVGSRVRFAQMFRASRGPDSGSARPKHKYLGRRAQVGAARVEDRPARRARNTKTRRATGRSPRRETAVADVDTIRVARLSGAVSGPPQPASARWPGSPCTSARCTSRTDSSSITPDVATVRSRAARLATDGSDSRCAFLPLSHPRSPSSPIGDTVKSVSGEPQDMRRRVVRAKRDRTLEPRTPSLHPLSISKCNSAFSFHLVGRWIAPLCEAVPVSRITCHAWCVRRKRATGVVKRDERLTRASARAR